MGSIVSGSDNIMIGGSDVNMTSGGKERSLYLRSLDRYGLKSKIEVLRGLSTRHTVIHVFIAGRGDYEPVPLCIILTRFSES